MDVRTFGFLLLSVQIYNYRELCNQKRAFINDYRPTKYLLPEYQNRMFELTKRPGEQME